MPTSLKCHKNAERNRIVEEMHFEFDMKFDKDLEYTVKNILNLIHRRSVFNRELIVEYIVSLMQELTPNNKDKKNWLTYFLLLYRVFNIQYSYFPSVEETE